jgi:hypothetical protein
MTAIWWNVKLWNYPYEAPMLRYLKSWIDQLRWQRLKPIEKLAQMLLDPLLLSRWVHLNTHKKRQLNELLALNRVMAYLLKESLDRLEGILNY